MVTGLTSTVLLAASSRLRSNWSTAVRRKYCGPTSSGLLQDTGVDTNEHVTGSIDLCEIVIIPDKGKDAGCYN